MSWIVLKIFKKHTVNLTIRIKNRNVTPPKKNLSLCNHTLPNP